MATIPENAVNARGVTRFLEAQVRITSPGNNAKLGSSFTMIGVASCEAFRDDGAEIIDEGDVTQSITAVTVRLGGDTNPFQPATPKGPTAKPWQNWSFAVNTTLQGQLTITARVRAERTGHGSHTATDVRQVVIDLIPPTFTIHPPDDVTKPDPPYVAIIKGTAADEATGVAAVEWRLSPSDPFQSATGTTNWLGASAAAPPHM